MAALDFDDFLKRVFEAAGIDSQTDLARILKVNRSAVTQARKKGAIPDRWLLQLYRSYGLNQSGWKPERGMCSWAGDKKSTLVLRKYPRCLRGCVLETGPLK